jgi:hypothetical protein
MAGMAQQYLELSKRLGVEPDSGLLAPIVETFH